MKDGLNIDREDRSDDTMKPTDADVLLVIYPAFERRRVLHVILPKDAARAIEDEALAFAKAHGKVKLHGEEVPGALLKTLPKAH